MKDETNKLIKELSIKNKIYSKTQIVFTPYCIKKMFERGVEENLVISTLLYSGEMYYAEKQEIIYQKKPEIRYKQIHKISSRYSLIIIVSYMEKVLKVINVIKTSKGAEKLWRKKALK